MKLTLTLALSTLILSAAALPLSLTSLVERAEAVLDKRHGGPPGPWDHWDNNNQGKDKNNQNNNWGNNNNQGKDNQNNQNNGGHDANWNGVYEQTPNCTPADGVATDGNQFWADNCDLGAGENGFGQ